MIRILIFALALVMPATAVADDCPRTISIGGALTEIVYKLGKEDCLVGADTTSTYPKEASELPMIGYQRMLSAEGILSLKPELIIHTEQAGPPAVIEQIDQAGIKRIEIEDQPSLEAVFHKIEAVSEAFDVEDDGQALIEDMKAQKGQLGVAEIDKPKVLFVMQHGPSAPMVGGKNTAADAIIALAGGENVVEFDLYKPLTPEALATLNPDIIVTTDESMKQMGGMEGLRQMPGVVLTNAAKNNNIVAMDALLILGFGPRTIEAAQELSKAFANGA